jgi:glycosyltransferase involved in cell wall biosynthesis
MRVSFVLTTPYRAETAGGAERWVAEAARALGRRVTVSVEYLFDGAGWEEPGTRGHRSVGPPTSERDRLLLAPGLVRAGTNADVVHVQQFGTLSAQLTALTARVRRRGVFVTDLGSSGLAAGRRLGLDRLFHGFLELSEFAAAQAPPGRTRVIYGGVDTERFRPGPKAATPYALYVGRILPHKGVDWLIRARPPRLPLVVAGRPDPAKFPSYLPTLRSLADGKDVRFEIDPPDGRVAELYAGAAVSVLPSVSTDVYGTRRRVPELLGLTALEALASGTPVVASRVASLPEIVTPERTGLLVDERDEPGLRAALERLAGDPAEAARMGEAGRTEVLSRFTWDQVADRCLSAYRELGPQA